MSNRYSYAQKKLLSSLVSFPPTLTKTNLVFYKIQKHISWFSHENQEYLEKIIEAIKNDTTLDIHWQQLSNLDVYLNDLSDKDVGVDLEKSYEFLKKQREFFLIEAVKEKGQSITNKQWMEEARRVLKETEEVEDIKIRDMETIRDQYLAYYMQECDRPKDLMDFGIDSLDKRIKIGAGLHIIAGLSNSGKTKLAVQLFTRYLLKNDKPCLMFSLEQTGNQVIDQMIAQGTGLNFSAIKKKHKDALTTEELAVLRGFFDNNLHKMLEIFDMERLQKADVETICGIIRKVKFEKGDVGMVCVDYSQLMRSSKIRSSDLRLNMVEVSRSLRLLSLELGIPIILLAQANRSSFREKLVSFDIEGKELKFVDHFKHDIAESASLENDADTILFINKSTVGKFGLIKLEKVKDGVTDPTETQNYNEEVSPYIIVYYNSANAKFENCNLKYNKINK